MDDSRRDVFLVHEVLDGGMVSVNDHLVADDVWPKFVKGEDHG